MARARFRSIAALTTAQVLAWGALSAAPAWGQTGEREAPTDEARSGERKRSGRTKLSELIDTGVRYYKARRYAKAAAVFERAFKIRQAPELAYNIARAYERALRIERAIAAYERFLGMTGTAADLRSKARASLQALRREQALTRAPPPPPPPPPVAPPPAAASPTATDAPSRLVATAPAEAPSRILEYTLIGTGAAAVIAGSAFAVLAATGNSDLDSARSQFPADPGRISDLEDEVSRNSLLADVLIGSGLATAGVGVLLFFVRGPSDSDTIANFVPIADPSQVGVAAVGHF